MVPLLPLSFWSTPSKFPSFFQIKSNFLADSYTTRSDNHSLAHKTWRFYFVFVAICTHSKLLHFIIFVTLPRCDCRRWRMMRAKTPNNTHTILIWKRFRSYSFKWREDEILYTKKEWNSCDVAATNAIQSWYYSPNMQIEHSWINHIGNKPNTGFDDDDVIARQ